MVLALKVYLKWPILDGIARLLVTACTCSAKTYQEIDLQLSACSASTAVLDPPLKPLPKDLTLQVIGRVHEYTVCQVLAAFGLG